MIGRTIGNYDILEQLGAGGMGEVYLARDRELERKIALKVLPEDLAANAERLERFKREAKTLAGLNHPNIVTIYSAEESEGVHFLTMELVEGRTLTDLLPARGMSLGQIFEIGIPLADALAAAHDKGVVHRDLKPGNIMLTRDGRVKVLDFGLAKLWQEASHEGETDLYTESLTGQGGILGTVPYMSPEQLEGKDLDTRSDIFALGVILYEMATGARPFQGESSASLMSSILKDTPRQVDTMRSDLPRHLGRIIRLCLEKNPDNRVQTARDVRNQLETLQRETITEEASLVSPPTGTGPVIRRLAAGAALLLALAVGGWGLWQALVASEEHTIETPAPAEALSERKKIVVLPFENLGEPDDEYFADGMTEEITSRLAVVEGLAVISRTSAMQYKDDRPPLRQIGQELDVDYVLEGTVRWQRSADGPSQVRVTPQLIQVADDTHLWAERYDAVLADIFEVQSDIARQVSEELGIALLEPQLATMKARPTENLEAYDFYLRGNDYLNRGKELHSAEEVYFAIQMYERALELDRAFALAWAQLSDAQSWLYEVHQDRTQGRLARAREAVDQALEIDPELPEAHFALGTIYFLEEGKEERALDEYQTALEGQPNNAEFYEAISFVYTYLGQWEEALASLHKAMELNPRLGRLPCWTGGHHFALRRFDEALRLHDRAIELTPDRSCPYVCEAWIYLNRDGDTERTRRFLEEELPRGIGREESPPLNYPWVTIDMMDGRYEEALTRLFSGPSEVYDFALYYIPKELLAAQIYGLMDRPQLERTHYETAAELLEEKVEERPRDSRLHGSLGIAYAGLGRKEEAVREGKRGLELVGDNKAEALGYRIKDLAQVHVMVGEHDEAIEQLERLLSIPAFFAAPYVKIDPTWAPLRDDRGFQALLQKYG